jgi:hypothetical protein
MAPAARRGLWALQEGREGTPGPEHLLFIAGNLKVVLKGPVCSHVHSSWRTEMALEGNFPIALGSTQSMGTTAWLKGYPPEGSISVFHTPVTKLDNWKGFQTFLFTLNLGQFGKLFSVHGLKSCHYFIWWSEFKGKMLVQPWIFHRTHHDPLHSAPHTSPTHLYVFVEPMSPWDIGLTSVDTLWDF